MTHGSEWDTEIWRPSVENVTLGCFFPCPTNDCVSYLLSYDKKNNKKHTQNLKTKNNVEYILRLHLVNVTWPLQHTEAINVKYGERMIMLNVTWRRFDQSVKQLIVGHTTMSIVCRTEDLFCQRAGYFRKICIKMKGAFYIDCLGMLKNEETIKGGDLPPCRFRRLRTNHIHFDSLSLFCKLFLSSALVDLLAVFLHWPL